MSDNSSKPKPREPEFRAKKKSEFKDVRGHEMINFEGYNPHMFNIHKDAGKSIVHGSYYGKAMIVPALVYYSNERGLFGKNAPPGVRILMPPKGHFFGSKEQSPHVRNIPGSAQLKICGWNANESKFQEVVLDFHETELMNLFLEKIECGKNISESTELINASGASGAPGVPVVSPAVHSVAPAAANAAPPAVNLMTFNTVNPVLEGEVMTPTPSSPGAGASGAYLKEQSGGRRRRSSRRSKRRSKNRKSKKSGKRRNQRGRRSSRR